MEKRKVPKIKIKLKVWINKSGKCRHNRIKRNFPFGRKSQPRRFCKDCGETVTAKMIRSKITRRRMIQ